MRLLPVLTICLSFATSAALAQCAGTDLRATLPDDDAATVARVLANTPYPAGNHWLATRGDERIHLIGTIHLDDPRLGAIAEQLHPVIAGANKLLLEMDKPQEAALKTALASDPGMLLLTDTTLPELMDEADWQALAKAAQARGVPAVMAAKFQPWYLTMLLAVPPCLTGDLANRNGLDHRLETIARAEDVPTAALESFDTIFEQFRNSPLDMQVEMMTSSIVDDKTSEDMIATLLGSYFDQAHAESWQVSKVLSRRLSSLDAAQSDAAFAALEQVLLIDRNRAWMPVILAAAEEGPVVAAFGAGHLSGRDGILELLEEEGFALSRQPF
ncbi:TraB/GumN family protein [Puniceibacterium sp. IMCC21224]|uniref:TraB/GumN family protein n=1 Tax=Puniceibacterium sp. IMCC21224 TaxID=1618204 RepID=UPI00064D8236|nr:TraB/GumN family protein [Puniceibacterium sp. IMCC21224]KMK68627.1 hypothetical protein IMCC21224_113510 [Puniceibacterium sp. IMCC21224]